MKHYFALFLAGKYLKPSRSFITILNVISLVGIILGVAVLILVLSVMEGFELELRKKVIGFHAHMTVVTFGILEDDKRVGERLLEDARVEAVSPFVLGPVLAQYQSTITTPFIRGIRLEDAEKVAPMERFLVSGEWRIGPDTVLVGEQWANKNDAMVGDRVLIHSPKNIRTLIQSGNDSDANRSFYLPTEYTIAGIFRTGMFDYDFNFFLIDLSEAQRLYSLGAGVHGISVRLKNPDLAFEVQQNWNQTLPAPLHALTWMDQNRQLFEAVMLERRVMAILLFFVILVASFGIMSTLLTVTIQKSRAIGLLKALGAQDSQVAAVFTLYGLLIGVLGSLLGVAGGMTVLHFRNDFSRWLSATFQLEVFPAEVYHFSEIPAVWEWQTIIGVAITGVLLSTLAAAIPAMMASRFDPVQTLRNE